MDVGRSWGSAIVAASRVAGHLLSGPALRRYRTTWGATEDEVAAAWPGDEFLPDPDWTSTHAITISASPDEVWPWVAQIGQGRGGLYSFEKLENLIGCQIRNVGQILPEHQDPLAAGEIRLAPQVALPVVLVNSGKDLVLMGDPGSAEGQITTAGRWSLHLRVTPSGHTRLIERLGMRAGPSLPEKLFTSITLVEPVSYVMSREMLRNIKMLAESGGDGRAGQRGPVDSHTVKPGVALALFSFQVSLAATAWTDLLFRSPARIRCSKVGWAWIAAIPFVGPLAYFIRGMRR